MAGFVSRKRLLFTISSCGLFVLFVYSLWLEGHREWMAYQRDFNSFQRQLAKKEGRPNRPRPIRIEQVILNDLNRVDRCMSCHLGINTPALSGAPQPFRTHPGEWLTTHPIEQFGCTVCHMGQGRATTVEAAHGHVEHWDWPMRDAQLMQASCAKCHEDIETLNGAEVVAKGKGLFETHGCLGCHALHGKGQGVSVDLTTVGSKVKQEFDFTHVQGSHTVENYHLEHFMDPPAINRGDPQLGVSPSAMPNFGLTEEEAKALTAYILSLTREAMMPTYLVKAEAKPKPSYATQVEAGHAAFITYGCIGCHNRDGRGGRINYNAWPGGEVPPLIYVANLYTREELKEVLKKGRIPSKLDPSGPAPPLWMPAWEGKIPEEELEAIIEYLFNLVPEEKRDVSISEGGSLEQK